MTEFILFGIVLLALATIYTGSKKSHRVLFDKISDTYLVYVSIHALYALTVGIAFGFNTAIDRAAPFIFGYAFWTLLLYLGLKEDRYSEKKKQFVKTCSYSLVIVAFLFAVIAFSGYISVYNLKIEISGLVVYSVLFISVIVSFVLRINNLVSSNTDREVAMPTKVLPLDEEKAVEEIKVKGSISVQKYNKSALSPVVLDDYRDKLDRFINIEKVYLDNELTLDGLAQKMRMPMHHLTQLFNVYLGENFNQYINRFRVDYACQLLLDNDGSLSIEQIAFNSGFNSKVSFNRHFKNITGSSPKEYVNNKRSTDN